ncbi:Transcriptional regulator, TetR family [Parafrankia sp. Ea1.12]|uniref:TetR/AcrR family transcriptional regulator n=1 Tax=Parafrankia sp. Ea1.12 TaxID=573499 RepID=UPI000DA5CF7A|nr:TetR/AcrR family transcriptional regulator [Parafrankia sp. Ea1.12]SQD94363.1 Transcriptional regulator, TetR family [Parafrankia sp. Ea1.12]
MPPKKGTPNRRGVARREQILDAAVELFARYGYRGTGLLELAERIGISHSGILHHFGTKEDLLRAVMVRRDELVDQAATDYAGKGIFGAQDLQTPTEPDIVIRLVTVLRAENLDPEDPLHDYFDQRDQQTRGLIADEIRRGQQRGEIRSDIDAAAKATEIVAVALGIETQWLLNPTLIDRSVILRSYLRALRDDLTRPDAPRQQTETPK